MGSGPYSPVRELPGDGPETACQACCAGIAMRLVSLGNTRCAYGLLDGGRNSLLKSAQEATHTSLAISVLQRQLRRSGKWQQVTEDRAKWLLFERGGTRWKM